MDFMTVKLLHVLPHIRHAIALVAAMGVLLALCPANAANGLHILPGRTVDLGTFPAESSQTATFTLSNTTSHAIHIENIESCCAYLELIIYEKTIAPGASIPLDVFIDAHALDGPFNKSVSFAASGSMHQTTHLRIKGTAVPAIAIPSRYVFSGRIALGRAWSTNLAITVRGGLAGKLVAEARSNVGLAAHLNETNGLQLTVPPQRNPRRWQAEVHLRLEGQPHLPPVPIQLGGYIGGSLVPQPSKLVLGDAESAQATIALFRESPIDAPSTHGPLQCSPSDIEIEEEYGAEGESTVTLKCPTSFMQRLKTEKRIRIQLSAAGFIPAIIVAEYHPQPGSAEGGSSTR
jgi:hypothetical protein